MREVRQQAQFDLRVIGSQQHVARFRDESGTDAASEFGADRNILQIGVRGGQTACCGSGLAERCVQAAGCWIDQRGERVNIC